MRQNIIKNFILIFILLSVVLYRFEVIREIIVFLQRNVFKFNLYRLIFSYIMR